MFDKGTYIRKIVKYYTSLHRLITEEATFSFGNQKVVKRNKINDILCCAKSNFPEEYWDYIDSIKRDMAKVLPKSYQLYLYIESIMTQKFWIFSDYCKVDVAKLDCYVREIISSLELDLSNLQ